MKTVIKCLVVSVVFLTIITGGCGSSPSSSAANQRNSAANIDELDIAIRDASDYLKENIPKGSKIVILNIESTSHDLSNYIIDELIANAVNDRAFSVVDRQQLDAIRAEQNFQLSGEVDDKDALAIGRFFGAQTIVSGAVNRLGTGYRIRIRALEVQTAQVQGQFNRNIASSPIMASLAASGGSPSGTAATVGGIPVQAVPSSPTSSVSGATGGTGGIIAPTVTGVIVSPDSVSVDKGGTTATADGRQIQAAPLSTVDTTSTKESPTVEVPGALNVNNVATWNTAVNKIRSGGNDQTYVINVTGNVLVPVVAENLFGSVIGLTVTIQGGGTLTISNTTGSLLRIGERQTVIARNITLRGRSGNNSAVVRIESGGTFRMEGSVSVMGNSNGGSGGGVNVNGGTFIMQGGSISGNTAGDGDGGGVNVNSGTFTMQGGSISGNSCKHTRYYGGGGVSVNGGTFTMQGGSISSNTAGYDGGGVYVRGGTFSMQGGTVSGNTANGGSGGGGVCVYNGTFTKTGGTIHGSDETSSLSNTAKSQKGHAVYRNSNPARWRNATAGPDDNTTGYGFWLND